MIPIILIEPDIEKRVSELGKILSSYKITNPHPNLMWNEEEKLGIGEVRKIQEHLSLKPYQGDYQAIVLVYGDNLTLEAQNAFLKTLEEPPGDSIILLGAASEDSFLPTVLSRCQVISRSAKSVSQLGQKKTEQIEQLLKSDLETRFQMIEKTTDRDQLLEDLVSFYHQKLQHNPDQPSLPKDLNLLLEAQKWAKANVNIRAILEFLMLEL